MKKSIALFDVDGTITTHDSTQTFYKFIYNSKFPYFFNNYVLCFGHIILYRLKLMGERHLWLDIYQINILNKHS